MDDLEALAIADDLRSAYPGRTITDDAVRRWAHRFAGMTAYQAREVARRLSDRSGDPPSNAAITQALDEVIQRTMSAPFDPSRCVYADGVVCNNCDLAGVVHGPLLDPDDFARRFHDHRVRLAAVPGCRECGVSHITRTHEEHRARMVEAFRRYTPKAKYAPTS